MKVLVVILILFAVVFAQLDYYQTLGVPRNADEAQLKKAFKKLSIKFHPDKNENDPDGAKARFQEIVNAYETLQDPKMRNVYDRHGEQGLKEYQQQQGNQGGGHFGDFHQFFGGGGRFNQERHEDFFSQSDVYKIDMESMGKFYRRREVWIIFFYKSNQAESKQIKDLWREFATQYYGIFRVAAINGSEQEELCEEEFQNYEYPNILIYPANIQSEPIKYVGEQSINRWANAAVEHMENFVRFVNEQNYQEFIDSDIDKHKVLLFTEQKFTPPLMRALSKEMLGKLIFGEVRSSETTLVQKLGITNFPSVLHLTDPDNFQGTLYDGVFKQDQMMKFLREIVVTKPNRRVKSDVKLFTNEMAKFEGNCGKSDKNICLFGIYDPASKQKVMQVLNHVAAVFKDSPIKFYYIPAEGILYDNIFNEDPTYPSYVVIKGQRGTFYRIPGENPNEHQVEISLDSVIGGSGDFKKIQDPLFGNIYNVKEDL